jgi:putative ABC transport system permease protein
MFWRVLRRLVWASRGRLMLALLSVASGAAVCAALVNLNFDATDKFTREFRALGANVIVSPPPNPDATPALEPEVLDKIAALHAPEILAAAPYVYVVAQAGETSSAVPVIVAGTRFNEVSRMNSWWQVAGQWVTDRGDATHCMAGVAAARQLGLAPGSHLVLRNGDRQAEFTVSGVVTAGGSEDSQIFVSLAAAQSLARLGNRAALAQVSVRGTSPVVESVIARMSAALPGLEVRPVRQLAAAEGGLLQRIRGLLFATVLLVLVLSSLGVLAATAGLAIERRRDVGLMKAIGGPVRGVMRFFLAETLLVAVVGGILGGGAGLLLSRWIGERVFSTAITPRLVVLPLTIGVMIGVALAGAIPLRLLGRVRPAEILRGE